MRGKTHIAVFGLYTKTPSRLTLALQNRNEIDPRKDEDYQDSDFQPYPNIRRKTVGQKNHMMEYIGGDGSHHSLNRRYPYFPNSNKFSKRYNILDSGKLKPVYSSPYIRVASPDPVRYGRQAGVDYYSRLLRL